jgi:opacity protein-like surface antigen
MKIRLIISIFFLLSINHIKGQNNRINTSNNIGWYNYFGTFKVSSKLGIHTEYQWRRNYVISEWQQSLFRVGLNYNVNQRVLLRIGYGLIETFPYGEIPINVLNRNFTEHRFFEMLQMSHKEGTIDFSHRFMLEQRFVGRYSSLNIKKEDEFPLLNRIRYMVKLQVPLKSKDIKDNTPYFAFYNEIFIGFGQNVTANIFDQNRIGVLLGYRFNKNIRIEVGYLNQTLQLGREINGQNVFQNNNGIILNANFNFDLTKK